MTAFETLEKHEVEFEHDKRDFIQVEHKIVRGDDPADTTEFIALTRGYIDSQGAKRYKTNLTFPMDTDIAEFVCLALASIFEKDMDSELVDELRTVMSLSKNMEVEQ